jgi:alpha-beta hydrolase superfamily lysophospholipase
MKKRIKIIGKILAIILLLYLIVCAWFYFFQASIIFQSESLPKDYTFTFDQKFDERNIISDDGETLNALLFKTDQPAKGLILYFHGNADNLQRWGNYAIDFTSLGYDILMTDYRGYGKSTGLPDEENLYKDAQTILNWAQSNIKYERLVIYGRSLGSAVASNLATTANPDLLILETPFEKLSGALYFLPSRYDFPNNAFVPKVRCRKVFIHGTEDWVVPVASAMKLKPFLNDNDSFVLIEGGSHNNLREFKKYHETLKSVLN